MTMAEKMARAISAACPITPHPQVAAHMALAALEAMRKPTPRMLIAAGKSMSPAKRPTPKRISVKAKHAVRYTAMIDQAIYDATHEEKQ